MKLSQVLNDWPKKKDDKERDSLKKYFGDIQYDEGFNTALESCDHEIDREALHEIIAQAKFDGDTSFEITVKVIATMPTWLKRIER